MKKILSIIILFISFSIFAQNEVDEFKGQYICFKSHLIKVKANYERVRWPGTQFTNVCSLSFNIDSVNPAHFYYSRGWHDPLYCKKFLNEWNVLRKKHKKFCIAAEQHGLRKAKYKGKDILRESGYWEIIRSGKWCRSYFIRDNCDLEPLMEDWHQK